MVFKKPALESDMFEPVKALLKSQGFPNVFGEVCDVDVYGHDGKGTTVSVEMKKSLNVKVLSQAMDNISTSHYTYVAVPYVKGLSSSWKVLRKLGLGLIVVKDGKARVSLKAPRNMPKRTLIKYIMPHHSKTVGGKKSGDNPTAYSETMARVRKYLLENPMSTIDDIFENVETHYTGKNKKNSLRTTLNAKWNSGKIGTKKCRNRTLYYYKGEE